MSWAPRSEFGEILRAFPGAVLEISAAGVVLQSNRRLEAVLQRELLGTPFESVIDTSSREKWQHVRASGGVDQAHTLWELVLETPSTLELRTFVVLRTANAQSAHASSSFWLVEFPRDPRLVQLYEKLAAANSELAQVHRELSKERARLARTLGLEEAARRAAESATARLETLHAVTIAALESRSLAETAQRLLVRLRAELGTDSATIYLLDEPARELAVFASDGMEVEVEQRVRVPVGRGFAGRVAATRAPVFLRDVDRSEIVSPYLQQRIRSAVGVPLLLDTRLTGVIAVGSATERDFTPEDVQLLELVARDVASAIERARLLERERAARADAEAAVRFRDEVLSIVAHDLRNPLNRLASAADMLADDTLAPDGRVALLGVLKRAAASMNRLIGDLLDVGSLEAGRLSMEPHRVDVRRFVEELAQQFVSHAARRRIALETDLGPGVVAVRADEQRLAQALGNLLDNAIRLTPEGGKVRLWAESAESAISINVSDTGPGIAREELPHIFDRFWQGDRNRRGSAGLGLAITKGIVEAHGGRIHADSTPGSGSTFSVLLPNVP